MKDAKYLLEQAKVQTTLLGDTAYEAEHLHEAIVVYLMLLDRDFLRVYILFSSD